MIISSFLYVHKVTEIFCINDTFDKNLDTELGKNQCLLSYDGNIRLC